MRFLLTILFITAALSAAPQDIIVRDSVFYDTEETSLHMQADSADVTVRSFEEGTLKRLKRDNDLQYTKPPTIALSLWDRFWMWISEMIEALFRGAVTTDWGRVFVYLLGLGVLVIVILLVLKVDAFKFLYRSEGASVMKQTLLDENIHEIDFDAEIQAASDKGDYRRGIRLLFLYALKLLSDGNFITWEQGKTNHEYVSEVKEEGLRSWLNQLSFYFDYAWYGNFAVSRNVFDKVKSIFNGGRSQVR